jgi:hypothetical protein
MIIQKATPRSRNFRVFVVEDHPIVREAVKIAVNDEHDMEVCGEADMRARWRLIALASRNGSVLETVLKCASWQFAGAARVQIAEATPGSISAPTEPWTAALLRKIIHRPPVAKERNPPRRIPRLREKAGNRVIQARFYISFGIEASTSRFAARRPDLAEARREFGVGDGTPDP